MNEQDNGTIASDEVAGEQFTRAVVVDVKASTVRRAGTIKRNADASPEQIDWTYDFSTVSEEQLLELASRTVHISRQGQWRKAEPADRAAMKHESVVDVAAMLAAERAGFKPTAKSVSKQIGKLSAEEKAALLKMLSEG
jgi:hypothetical protein